MDTDPGDAERRWARRYSRPYIVSGGRTRPTRAEFEIEALVSITTEGETTLPLLNDEWRMIAELCLDAFCSIAELSAHLRIPIGVTRVLVGDMVSEGLLTVHRPAAAETGDRPDRALLERVLAGLRRLPS